MKNKEKVIQIFFIIVILVGLSVIPRVFMGEQRASVSLFFWSSENRNETVRMAQERLTELGLYDGNISGLFGLRTRVAIFNFQEQYGLVRNGILDIPTQQALFSPIVPTQEHLTLSYTDTGNTFLSNWARYILGVELKRAEISGQLILGGGTNTLGPLSSDLVLRSEDGNSYKVFNISNRDIGQFLNQYVTLNGFWVFQDGETLALVLNHVEPGEENLALLVEYTEAGNQQLIKWVSKIYNETHELSGFIGKISVGAIQAPYAPGGNKTKFILTTPEGVSYSIENISPNDMSVFVGSDVMVRGVLLDNENSLGIRIIVINHVEGDGSDGTLPTGVSATSVGI